MKKMLLSVIVTLFATSAMANDDLAAAMKVIGEQFKVLGTAVQTKSFSSRELEAVETMQDAIADAALTYPDSATDDALKVKFSRWMAELMRMAITLEKQGELILEQSPQNMSDVTQTLMDMNELRKEAHDLFKTN